MRKDQVDPMVKAVSSAIVGADVVIKLADSIEEVRRLTNTASEALRLKVKDVAAAARERKEEKK